MKKIIVKVLITVFCIGAAIFIVTWLDGGAKDSGVITIVLIDENSEEVISEDIEFAKYTDGEQTTLLMLLEENFSIIFDSSGLVLGFEGVITDGTSSFLKIYVNNIVATKGVQNLEFKDNDEIKFVYTMVGDN